MGDEPKMVIQVDNKELMEYFESWLEDFRGVSEGMLEKINVDRGATLKIPESDFRKLRMLTESMDGLAKKKFGFENAPDFSPMVASMKRLEACIEKIYIPEEIEVKMPNIEFPAIPAPVVDFTPILRGFQDMTLMFQKGISASITNFDQMPLVFDKTIGGAGSATGGTSDATEATLQAILSALSDVVTNTAAISIDADSVNLNTDTLEALITAGNASLSTINGKIPALGQALAAASVPVVLTAAQLTTLTPPTPQTDALTDTQLRATPVPVSGTVTANLSATDNAVLDQIELNQDSQTALLTTIDADTGAMAVDLAAIEVLLTTIEANQLPDSHNVTVDNASIAVTGTFWQATQPVSGTITANLSATDNAVLDAIAAALAGTLTVTGGGGGTEYTEDAAAAANPVGNALMLVREDARAGSLTTTDGDNVALRGNNKGEAYVKDTDAAALLTTIDADTGAMVVDLAAIEVLLTTIEANQLADSHNVTVDNASIAVTGTFWQATQPVSGTITAELSAIDNAVLDTIDAVLDTIKTDTAAIVTAVQTLDNAISGSEMQVDVLTMPTVAVTGTFWQATQPVSIASVPSHAVTNAGTFAVQVDGNALTALQLIDDMIFADDAAYTLGTHKGSVVQGIAVETDGTDPTSVSAEGDAASVRTDRNRRLLTNDMHPNSFVLFEDHTTAQTNNQLKAAPGAGLSIYITDIIISNGATAGSLKVVEDEGGTPVQIGGTIYLAINGGAVMNFKTPKRLTANKSLGFTSTTVTTHSIEIHGYIAP